jgi:uridine kinase
MEKHVSFTAQFDSSAQDPERICHPGTRQNVLKRAQDWIDNPCSTERILWVHGPAGAGKSAIAQTIAHSCGRQKVPATFFFFRSDASRNDGNRLFTTLAYQLAFSIPAIKDHIVQSLHERPDLPTKTIEKQFDHFIALPFRSLNQAASAQSSPASIIDAVNQCQQLAPVIIIDGVDCYSRCILRVIQGKTKEFKFEKSEASRGF